LIRDLLEQLVAGGATVVFSSHVMEVVERLCDHVAVMHQGRVVAEGVTAELCDGRRLEDVFVDKVGAIESSAELDWLTP
jgi:ABC-2 type transport system ATP-binding protein